MMELLILLLLAVSILAVIGETIHYFDKGD